jgi:hypothetical protein
MSAASGTLCQDENENLASFSTAKQTNVTNVTIFPSPPSAVPKGALCASGSYRIEQPLVSVASALWAWPSIARGDVRGSRFNG